MDLIKSVLPAVLSNLQSPETLKRTQLVNEWGKIAGPKLAPHTRPSLAKDGVLYVWADRSALAFEINQRYKASLLKRAQAVVGEKEIKQLRVRVGQLRY